MHIMHLTPALLLALAGTTSANVIHTELRSELAANASVTTYSAILEASPAALTHNVHADKVFLTNDNSCGKIGAGKNHGWYCDPKKDKGGACCSSDGWCGNGSKYCEAGCQEDFGHCDKGVHKPSKPVARCGPKNKDKKCNNDECCSINGFCGKNKNFCGVGCQDKFGKCAAKPMPAPMPAPKPAQHRCGPANGMKKCPGLDCCSHAGYCGIGTEYCAVPQSCLRGFGRCDSNMFPAGASTLKDPRPQLGEIEYGKYIVDCNEPGTVALTFDDGPNVYTNELLDKLKVAGAKATFMVGGNNNGRQIDQGTVWPELLKRMDAEGHQIASHTWSHPHLNAMKSDDRKMEMAKTERAIANIIGKYPTYMRPPYGECDEESGCRKDMKEMGYALVAQSFDTLDWKYAAGRIEMSEMLVEDYFGELHPGGHALLCQHDTLGASIQELTPIILDLIKDKGFRAVSLGECLGDDKRNWYRVPGKGISVRTSTVDTAVNEPEPECPESGYNEKDCKRDQCRWKATDELEGGYQDCNVSPRDDISIMPYPTPAPSKVEPEHEHAQRQFMPRILPSPVKSYTNSKGGSETDHEVEEVEMKLASNKPKLPTFPSEPDLLRRADNETLLSQAEIDTVIDEMAGRLMSPEEIAADNAVKMSDDDILAMAAAKKKCVFKEGKFCGKIQHFVTKTGCFKSTKNCYDQTLSCRKESVVMNANEKDKSKRSCWDWSQVCNQEIMFCLDCGGKGQPKCKSKHFKPSKLSTQMT